VWRVELGAPVKAVAYDPLESYIAAATTGGRVAVLGAKDGSAVCAALPGSKAGVRAGASLPETLAAEFPLAWHPRGDVLAYASSASGGVAVVPRTAWTSPVYQLAPTTAAAAGGGAASGSSSASASPACNAICWSPNGRYLASIDSARALTVWDVTEAAQADDNGAATQTLTPAVAMRGHVREILDDGGDDAGIEASQDAVPGAVRARMPGASSTICSVGWTSDGRTIVCADTGGELVGVKAAHL
jgi:hypothetical protein